MLEKELFDYEQRLLESKLQLQMQEELSQEARESYA